MRLTKRDVSILRDLVLSHVLSRDQLRELYFGSRTRVNTRIRELRSEGLIKRLETPFFDQALYAATPESTEVVGVRLAPLAATRTGSPRFLQHALSVTNTRLALKKKGALQWRFEQQSKTAFTSGGKGYEVRPDGIAILASELITVEVDLGHVAPQKFREKLNAYTEFVRSGECERLWRSPTLSLLVVTTGPLRAKHLTSLVSRECGFEVAVTPHDRMGIQFPGAWS